MGAPLAVESGHPGEPALHVAPQCVPRRRSGDGCRRHRLVADGMDAQVIRSLCIALHRSAPLCTALRRSACCTSVVLDDVWLSVCTRREDTMSLFLYLLYSKPRSGIHE